MSFETVVLNSSHNKKDFSCGKAPLDNYIRVQVSQDIKRKLSACFVHADEENNIIGYYTLSSDSIPQVVLPEEIKKKMPPAYKNLPVTLLGRLARDQNYRGKGIGELLLVDALKKAYETSSQIGSMAVVVAPLDEEAVAFYKKYDFIELPDSKKMFLPMKTIAELFK